MRMRAAGEVSFELTKVVSTNDSVEWMAYYNGNTAPPPEGTKIEVDRIDPTPGAKSTGRIEASIPGVKEGDELQVDGSFEVVGCGRE